MDNKKVLILLPDGVGLKNFAYTQFYKNGKDNGLDFTFWNATPFPLSSLGFKEIPLPKAKLNPLTDVYKNARKHIDLKLFKEQFNDSVYDTYKFPIKYNSVKKSIKNIATESIINFNNSDEGLKSVRNKIFDLERRTDYYKECYKILRKENPAILFCTNQRPTIAIAPILAAQDLGIPTTTFIFSWDNLPKATMVIETDYYFVWSQYMKDELLQYYSFIKESQIVITGTPQFENHLDKVRVSKSEFFENYNLDHKRRYICYSGDDITTSPDDDQYLRDVALAIKELNNRGHNLGVVFRRCPVDNSNRFDKVLNDFNDIIVPIDPKWQQLSKSWVAVLPSLEDLELQQQTIVYTEMVVNLGSSMVFDYAIHNKPCAFINYDAKNKKIADWSVKKIYKYIHFKSMHSKDSVIWLNNPSEIASKIEDVLKENTKTVKAAQDWFKVINLHPLESASSNIVNAIKNIIK